MLTALGCGSTSELIRLIQQTIGAGYRVTGSAALIEADEDEQHGGRSDDARRAADLQRALADDRVAGVVTLRGGAWLTRILPRIDFSVLRRRSTRVAIFGFSELTTVINVASVYPKAVCWYDMGPAFIPTGLRMSAQQQRPHVPHPAEGGVGEGTPPGAGTERSAHEQFPKHLAEFFGDVIARMDGRGSSRLIRGQLVAGKLLHKSSARFVGGTLSVLISLIGTAYARSIFRPGRWLAIEDVNEAPHRLDRALAHLKLSGILERCEGLLLGDFHENEHDRVGSVLASLDHVLPKRLPVPIVVTRDFGHIWPMAPLPIGRTVELRRCSPGDDGATVELVISWRKLATRRSV